MLRVPPQLLPVLLLAWWAASVPHATLAADPTPSPPPATETARDLVIERMQDTARETVTFRNKGSETALPVRRWMRLPSTYAISNASAMGVDGFLAALDRRIADGGLAQLQLREPAMDEKAFAALFDAVAARCTADRVRLLVNSTHPRTYWSLADGVHLFRVLPRRGRTRAGRRARARCRRARAGRPHRNASRG